MTQKIFFLLKNDLIVFDVFLIAYGLSYNSIFATTHLKSTKKSFFCHQFWVQKFMLPLWRVQFEGVFFQSSTLTQKIYFFLNYDLIDFDVYLIAYGLSYISTIATSHLKSTKKSFFLAVKNPWKKGVKSRYRHPSRNVVPL